MSGREAGRDRQVLVVGEGLAAAACAGFLEQAGMEPVLAPATGDASRPDAGPITLWHPGLVLLERIGLRRPIERLGTPLTGLDALTTGQQWDATPRERPALVAVRADRLSALLDRRLRRRLRTADRPVTRLEPTDAGVRATFRRNVEEVFDAVATSAAAPVPAWEPGSCLADVHTWSFEWPSAVPAPERPTAAWTGDRAALVTPVDGGASVQLVSTTDAPRSPVDVAALEATFGGLLEPIDSPFDALDGTDLHYARSPRAAPAALRRERLAFVGEVARAPLPGDCLRAALGVADAWVLADALAYGPPAVEDALGTYERRRRGRAVGRERLLETAAVPGDGDAGCSPVIERLGAARSVAFSHVQNGHLPDFATAVPDRL